jgi:hypothetical protein
VRHHGRCGDPAQCGVGQKGRRDDDAVAKVVDAVAHQHAQAATARLLGVKVVVVLVPIAFVVVHVAVQLGLFQQPEKQQATQQRGKQCLRRRLAFKSLGQHMQQRRAQQHAGRQADQVFDQPAQHRQRQLGRDQHRKKATRKGGQDDVEQGHGRGPGLNAGLVDSV